MGEQQGMNKPLRDLMEILHFTEDVSAKIHGLLDEAEIYRTVREEFARSKRYSASIALLTEDGSKLRVAEAALPAEWLKAWAKRTGLSLKEFQIDVDKSSICQVVREGKTLCVNVGDILGELFPRPLARLIAESMGFEKKPTILTPLKRHGKIIGAFAMSCTELAEHFIPSVRNLAQHISAALELARENAQRERAEEALRESEKKSRSLMESLPIGIAISTPEEDVIEINAALWQIFGYDSKEDLLKIPASAHYYDAKERERFIEARKKGLVSFEARFKRKDGTAFWGFVTSISQTTAAGTIQFINTFQDITERKRAEEELRLHSEIMANMVEGVILTRVSDGTIVYTNPKFEEMFGYGPGELVGKHISVVNAPTEKSPEKIAKDIMRSLRETGVWSGEVYNIKKDGTPFWCYANVSTFEHPEYGEVWVAVHTDITERKRAEEALRRQRDELAARSAILGATLSATDLDELLHLILDEVLAFLEVEFAGIHLVQADQVVLRAWRGLSAAFCAQVLSFPADDPPDWMKELCIVHEHLNDVDVTPGFAKGEGIQAWASIPLRLSPKDGGEEKWLGTLIVGSRRYEALNEAEVRALQAMGDQLGLAIDHTRTYRQALERLARLQTLRDIDRAIIQQLDLREVLHVVLERVPKELGADAVAISLLDEEQLRSEVFEMRLPNGTVVEEEAFELAESLLHWLVERQEPVIIYDVAQDPRVQVHRELIRNGRLVSYLGVPLVVHDETIGILYIMTTEPRVFADEDVAFFRTMAGQAAIAIENARLYEAVRQELAQRTEAEERYRSLFDRVPVGLYRTRPDGRVLDANPALVEMLGYPGQETLMAINVADGYVAPEERRRWEALIERQGVVSDFEVQWRRYDGTVIWVRDSARAVRDASDRILYYEGAVEDITRRKRAEERILRQRAVLEAVNKVFQEAFTCETSEEVARTCLAVAEKLTGSKFGFIGELNQAGLFDTIAISNPGWDACKMPESDATVLTKNMEIRGIDRSVLREEKSRIVNAPASHPDRVGTPEGHPPITCFLGVPLKYTGRTIGMIGLANKESGYDLADQRAVEALAVAFVEALYRKRAEEALRESEEKSRVQYKGIPVPTYTWQRVGEDFVLVDYNDAAVAITQGKIADFVGIEAREMYQDMPEILEEFSRCFTEKTSIEREMLYRYKSTGESKYLAVKYAFVPPDLVLLHTEDITERKRAERLLQGLNRAALAMEQALTPEEIFVAVAEELKKLGLSCMVFFTDESRSRLFPKYLSYDARVIKAAEKLTGLKTEEFSISVGTVAVHKEVVWERKVTFVENAEDIVRQVLPGPVKKFAGPIVKMLKIPKSISSPLIVENEVMGMLSVQSDDLTEEDVPAITAFSRQMAAAWRKAQLLQDLERSLAEQKRVQEELQHTTENLRKALGATIRGMALTVEARDPYTAGHQRRVADLARAIATEMGLAKEKIEGIRVAGGLHDIGKITVPTEILSKPGRINDIEFTLIKMHAQAGYDILKAIDFPWPVARIVLQHHERMDGSGYPQGLVGADIILEAKILAVADVVEAMASFRPYRPALGIDKALEEISQNRGVLYDPEVVEACLKLSTEKGFEFE